MGWCMLRVLVLKSFIWGNPLEQSLAVEMEGAHGVGLRPAAPHGGMLRDSCML